MRKCMPSARDVAPSGLAANVVNVVVASVVAAVCGSMGKGDCGCGIKRKKRQMASE